MCCSFFWHLPIFSKMLKRILWQIILHTLTKIFSVFWGKMNSFISPYESLNCHFTTHYQATMANKIAEDRTVLTITKKSYIFKLYPLLLKCLFLYWRKSDSLTTAETWNPTGSNNRQSMQTWEMHGWKGPLAQECCLERFFYGIVKRSRIE